MQLEILLCFPECLVLLMYKHVGLDDILVNDVDEVSPEGAGETVRAGSTPGDQTWKSLRHREEMVVIDWNKQDGWH